jgi:hypothetical protein
MVVERRDVLIESCLSWFTVALRLGEVSELQRRKALDLLEEQLKRMTVSEIIGALNDVMLGRRKAPAGLS